MMKKYIKASNYRKGGYLYFLKHGIGPGTLPKDVEIIQGWDIEGGNTLVTLDRFLTSKELREFDIPSETQLKYRLADRDYHYENRPDGFFEIINDETGEIVKPWRDDSKYYV